MWDKFKVWARHPFSVDMTAGEWFLFIGLLIIIVALWNIILFRITDLVGKQAQEKTIPRITLGIMVVALIFYLVGARWPMLAQKIGAA